MQRMLLHPSRCSKRIIKIKASPRLLYDSKSGPQILDNQLMYSLKNILFYTMKNNFKITFLL